jgi:hypothetical protein
MKTNDIRKITLVGIGFLIVSFCSAFIFLFFEQNLKYFFIFYTLMLSNILMFRGIIEDLIYLKGKLK